MNKPIYFHRFRVFGWNIYITRESLRRRDPKRSRCRTNAKVWRLEHVGYRCELCGRDIDIRCTLYHMLPKGAPERNHVANIRVICPECHQHVQLIGAYRPMIEKGGEA